MVSGCHRGLGTRCVLSGCGVTPSLCPGLMQKSLLIHGAQKANHKRFKKRARDCSVLATCGNSGTNSNVHLAIKEPREMLLLSPTSRYTPTKQTMAPRVGLKSHGSFSSCNLSVSVSSRFYSKNVLMSCDGRVTVAS